MRLLACGERAWLVELTDDDGDLTDRSWVRELRQALVDAVRRSASIAPVLVDVVPAARTVLVAFANADAARRCAAPLEQLTRTVGEGSDDVERPPAGPREGDAAEELVIPVVYDGDDLADVATQLGVEVDEVVRRHQQARWIVEFAGFAPGFGYLTQVGEPLALTVSRRDVPRPRIPRGAVALADEFAGVYPSASPGGWQIIGRTGLAMFDVRRRPSAQLTPGRRVRFVEAPPGAGVSFDEGRATGPRDGASRAWTLARASSDEGDALIVERVGPQALVEDLGRPGFMSVGLTTSGACDRAALRLANRVLGNDEGAPGVEVLLGGLSVRAVRRVVVAVTGAPVPLALTSGGTSGVRRSPEMATPIVLGPGDALTLATPIAGLRSYLAILRGFDAERVEGSAASDPTSGVGPALLAAGDVLRAACGGGPVERASLAENRAAATTLPPGPLVLHGTWGPRDEWFTDAARRALGGSTYDVTSDADRVGIRFDGPRLSRANSGELPSEPLVRGALQVPASGLPLMFFADHPTTGGYPVIAVIDDADVDLLAQARPGQEVRFALRRPWAPRLP